MAKRKKENYRRPFWAKLLIRLFLLGIIGAGLGALVLVGMFYYYGTDSNLPRISSVHDYRPKTTTRIFDRKGRLIGEISDERRSVVPFKRIPKLLVKAVVAAEDDAFYKHRGLDYWGMLRAFFANLKAGRFAQGGSTITQQVVKGLFLSPERTIRRKVQEVILARRLESQLAKNEILYLYLNQIYYGHGRYGVQEASRFFFGKDVDKLGLAECALLAGLPQSPERLSPVKHPKRAKKRQAYVLSRLAELGYISKDVAKQVEQEPIRIIRHKRGIYGIAPEITDIIRNELIKAYGEEKLESIGLDVVSTIDVKYQQAAKKALRQGLQAIDRRQGYRKALKHIKKKDWARVIKRLKRKQKRFSSGRNYRGLVVAIDDKEDQLSVDLGKEKAVVDLSGERYNPNKLLPSKRFKVGDLLALKAVKRGEKVLFRFDPGPQAILVAMDPKNGDVLAMVNGYRHRRGDYNRVLKGLRQPGSSFKPFLYGAALDSGQFSPATIMLDAPVVFGDWKPQNFDGKYRGPIRLRVALAHSINTVAARLIKQLGVEPVRQFAQRLGISSELGNDYSLALGTSGVYPIELATAYAAIANGGLRVAPNYILKSGHQEVKRTDATQVIRPEVAYVLLSMMQSVVREGTARRARSLGRPVAGKTGTTNSSKDAWFAGFTPQLVTVVWVGFDRPKAIGSRETGGRAALPIWANFMKDALRLSPKLPFRQPPNVVVKRIDPQSGLLAPLGAADALEEVFVAGSEPTAIAPSADMADPNSLLTGP